MNVPEQLRYSSDHEWVSRDGDIVRIGITDYAAQQLGDVVYVDLPGVGDSVRTGQQIGEIESTKSVGELLAPLAGAVLEVNQAVVDAPELVNADPFGEGWLVRISATELPPLLGEDEYRAGLS